MPNRKRKLVKKCKKKGKNNAKPLKKNSIKIVADCDGGAGTSKPKICFKKKYYKNELPRTLSPFNKFDSARFLDRTRSPSPYASIGLSPKEKSYIICNCQTRMSQYALLKAKARHAILQHKIFTIFGDSSCNPIRNALVDRAWIEKIPPYRMNLRKIKNGSLTKRNEIHGELERLLLSNFVEKKEPNFIWRTKEHLDNTIDMGQGNNTLYNKLMLDAMWTTKQGLCATMKQNYWFYIEDVAEVIGPRTYFTFDSGDIEGFVKDYKITACTSLLKWLLSMVANERPIFMDSGKFSLNVIVFALNRCKEYLFRKQNKDIDQATIFVSNTQWNAYLKKYYKIISREEIFETDKKHKLPLYLGYAKFLLKEIYKFRPQLSCEGCHNIWIIKPSFCSRGRGIRMASNLGIIKKLVENTNAKYVIQKYIEEPLLIHDTKFDIRQYYIVTSTYPLVIWMYQDCYLKFSSQTYSLKNYHESIHLTNNAVQRKYKNSNERHSELPNNNMWDLNKYKAYLDRIGKSKVWDNIIYPGMRKSIIGVMLSCQDSMSACKNRFELYGCDFILDKEYKPWLIEINSGPDLTWTTQITARICPAVLTDLIKVVIDYAANPNASTGRFECVYKQPMTPPRYYGTDLAIRGYSLPLEYFYRGNIPINESFDYLIKERDIAATIKKLKKFYDPDIMVEPEVEIDAITKREQETYTHRTVSEEELIQAASEITNQIEAMLKKLPLDPLKNEETPNGSAIEIISAHSIQSGSKSSYSLLESVKSLTDVNSLLKSTSHILEPKCYYFRTMKTSTSKINNK